MMLMLISRLQSQPLQRSHMQRYYISHRGLLFQRAVETIERYVAPIPLILVEFSEQYRLLALFDLLALSS